MQRLESHNPYSQNNNNFINTPPPQLQHHQTINPNPNQSSKKIENYIFKLNDIIGKGNFSTVYKGVHQKTGQIVAIKVVQLQRIKTPALIQLLYSEIQILKQLKHPNILACHQVFTSVHNCYIITELCNQGDLETKIRQRGPISQQEASRILYDVYQALKYLVCQGIIHRDFKIANILFNKGIAKIADFGFAKKSRQKFKDISIGSPIYMSPEGLIDNIYGPKTEVWAFGVMIYEILHGDTPLGFCQTQAQLKVHIVCPLKIERLKNTLSSDIKDLILRCLQIDERKRINMLDIQKLSYFRRIGHQPNIFNNNYAEINKNVALKSEGIQVDLNLKRNNLIKDKSNNATNNGLTIFPNNIQKNFGQINANNKSEKSKLNVQNLQTNVSEISSPLLNTINSNYFEQKDLKNQQNRLNVIGPTIIINQQRKKNKSFNQINTSHTNNQNNLLVPPSYSTSLSPSVNNLNLTSKNNSNLLILNQNMNINTNNNSRKKGISLQKNNSSKSNDISRKNNLNIPNNDKKLMTLTTGLYQNKSDKKLQIKRYSNSDQGKLSIVPEQLIPMNIKISFFECVHLLHYCRLLYKTIVFLDQVKFGTHMDIGNILKNWLFKILGEIQNKISTNVIFQGERGPARQKKLRQVVGEYSRKYHNQLEIKSKMDTNFEIIKAGTKKMLNYLMIQIQRGEWQRNERKDLFGLIHYLWFYYEVSEAILRCIIQKGDFGYLVKNSNIEGFLLFKKQNYDESTYRGIKLKLQKVLLDIHK